MKMYVALLTFFSISLIANQDKIDKKEAFDKKYEQLFKKKPSHQLWNKLDAKCNSTGGCSAGGGGGCSSSCKMK